MYTLPALLQEILGFSHCAHVCGGKSFTNFLSDVYDVTFDVYINPLPSLNPYLQAIHLLHHIDIPVVCTVVHRYLWGNPRLN